MNTGTPTASNRILASGALGGSRAVGLLLLESDFGQDSSIMFQDGAFGSNGFGNSSFTGLGYFSTAVSNNSNSVTFNWSQNTNFDFTGNESFEFDMLGNDTPLGVKVFMFGADPNGIRVYQKEFAAGGTRTETIGLGDITTDTIDVTKVDFLYVTFDAPRNADFGLDSIEAVPEPGTIAILGLGLAAAARRRRKN